MNVIFSIINNVSIINGIISYLYYKIHIEYNTEKQKQIILTGIREKYHNAVLILSFVQLLTTYNKR